MGLIPFTCHALVAGQLDDFDFWTLASAGGEALSSASDVGSVQIYRSNLVRLIVVAGVGKKTKKHTKCYRITY